MAATRESSSWPDVDDPTLQAIVSAAMVTRDAGLTTRVVAARTPTAVTLARELARCFGLQVTAEIAARAIKVGFSPHP
jgi:hypothetical protein